MYKKSKADAVKRKRDGLLSHILLQKGDTATDMLAVTWVDVEPRAAQKPHKHTMEEQVYIIVAGHGRMRVGDDYIDVRIGDCIYIPTATVHAITNTGNNLLTYISASTPAFDLEALYDNGQLREEQ